MEGDSSSAWDIGEINEVHTVAGLIGAVVGAGTAGAGDADAVAVGICRAGKAFAGNGSAHTVGIHPVRAVPHGQLRIEGRIIFDFTCSGVYHCIKEWAEAIFHVYVFFEATLPQTLQISNDKRILIVRSKSLGATDFRFYIPKDREDRVDGFASGNPTVPPAFIL